MNEQEHLLEAVLRGVSNPCLIILVSNSNETNFRAERVMLAKVCSENSRSGIIIHQQDEGLAIAFAATGMSKLVETIHQPQCETKNVARVRKGKGEAMMIGVAIAKLARRQFVGFIDADNWVSGSVQEYCKAYAAGLQYALSSAKRSETEPVFGTVASATDCHVMVRIKWNSKPKIEHGKLVSKESGRSSVIVNKWMNQLLDSIVPPNTSKDIIQTANAGEHVMTTDLAMELQFATGYAVEPFQLVNMWEKFGARPSVNVDIPYANDINRSYIAECSAEASETLLYLQSPTNPIHVSVSPFPPKVHIIQIQTCNPHIHDFNKGDEHIENMQVHGLSTIYHSRLAPQKLKDELRVFMKDRYPTVVDTNGEPDRVFVYPPLKKLNLCSFSRCLKDLVTTLEVIGDSGTLLP